MPRGIGLSKSIAKKLEKIPEPRATPILHNPDNGSDKSAMKSSSSFIKNVGSKRVNSIIETLVLSAIYNGCYSLAANQIGLLHSIFTVHKNLKEGMWLYPMKESEIPDKFRDSYPTLEEEMIFENFRIFANPKLIAVTNFKEYDWERCGSFPGAKAQVLRPMGIKLAYQTETGEIKEDNFFDFEARVICHELDHLQGKDITDWNISEGCISVDADFERDNKSLQNEVQSYKDKIAGLDQEFSKQGMKTDDFPEFQDNSIDFDNVAAGKTQDKTYYGKGAKFNIDHMKKMYNSANKEIKDRGINLDQENRNVNRNSINERTYRDLRGKK